MCGSAASCDGNAAAPTCDLANNQCVCGATGATACPMGETCMGGTCMCGGNPTCDGNTAADGCDGAGACTCGGMALCMAPTPTCNAMNCV